MDIEHCLCAFAKELAIATAEGKLIWREGPHKGSMTRLYLLVVPGGSLSIEEKDSFSETSYSFTLSDEGGVIADVKGFDSNMRSNDPEFALKQLYEAVDCAENKTSAEKRFLKARQAIRTSFLK